MTSTLTSSKVFKNDEEELKFLKIMLKTIKKLKKKYKIDKIVIPENIHDYSQLDKENILS